MIVAASILFLVMIVCFLINIIDAVVDTIDTNSERGEIIEDFFRYYKKVEKSSTYIHLTFKQFLAFYNVMPEMGSFLL